MMTRSRFWKTVFVIVCLALIAALWIICPGCRMIWTDEVYYCSLFTIQDWDMARYHKDPNSITVEISKYHAEPKIEELASLIELWMKGMIL